ncbi:hypothetical protein QJQ45_019644, partial [Haematococcus lacustris]
GPSNRPTASRPLYCATSLGTFAYLCARTARVLGKITPLLLGCATWAAALAASIATTLDATSPVTTAETTARKAAGEQPVTADGVQPAAAMAHLGHACFSDACVLLHEQQQQVVVYEQQCMGSSSSKL